MSPLKPGEFIPLSSAPSEVSRALPSCPRFLPGYMPLGNGPQLLPGESGGDLGSRRALLPQGGLVGPEVPSVSPTGLGVGLKPQKPGEPSPPCPAPPPASPFRPPHPMPLTSVFSLQDMATAMGWGPSQVRQGGNRGKWGDIAG